VTGVPTMIRRPIRYVGTGSVPAAYCRRAVMYAMPVDAAHSFQIHPNTIDIFRVPRTPDTPAANSPTPRHPTAALATRQHQPREHSTVTIRDIASSHLQCYSVELVLRQEALSNTLRGSGADAAAQDPAGPAGRQHHLRHQACDPDAHRGDVRQPPDHPHHPARPGRLPISRSAVTDAGRKLTVAFIYYAETNTAYPITAWEQS
jgi:hypothetical protein